MVAVLPKQSNQLGSEYGNSIFEPLPESRPARPGKTQMRDKELADIEKNAKDMAILDSRERIADIILSLAK